MNPDFGTRIENSKHAGLLRFLVLLSGNEPEATKWLNAILGEQRWNYVPEEASRLAAFASAWAKLSELPGAGSHNPERFSFSRNHKAVDLALEAFPLSEKISAYLYLVERFKQAETGRILQVSPSTISSRLAKIRTAVASALDSGSHSAERIHVDDEIIGYFKALIAQLLLPFDLKHAVPQEAVYNDSTERKTKTSELQTGVLRLVKTAVLIVLCGLLGYSLNQRLFNQAATTDDLVSRSAGSRVILALSSSEPEEIARNVRSRFSTDFVIPGIEGMELTGLAIGKPGDEIDVPVMVYGDKEGNQTLIFVFSYALLDRAKSADFSDATYQAMLNESAYFKENRSDVNAVLWRWRDDIYLAFPREAPETFFEKIYRM